MMKSNVRAVVLRVIERERKRCISLHKEALCLYSTNLCREYNFSASSLY